MLKEKETLELGKELLGLMPADRDLSLEVRVPVKLFLVTEQWDVTEGVDSPHELPHDFIARILEKWPCEDKACR